VVGTELREGYALAWTDVFEDSGKGVSGVVCCCCGGGDSGISYP
jgi:hypothetical protein